MALQVRDIKGNVADIVFSTDDDQPVTGKRCRTGYTVAILYPFVENHLFGGIPVIRIESLSSFMVIPCSLETLFTANDKMHERSEVVKCSESTCDVKENLSACSSCRIAKYCGREHQVKNWKTHKPKCHAYQALNWFIERDWTDWEDWWNFPK
ncbi:hypothetical protein QCA50_014276 [Cerrena zonata]|uniref:MYND-type domain-containing protein n=1 Tax=Cerrena zonata TaxID=2478898 RepID=A0AAW0FP63_9APHY